MKIFLCLIALFHICSCQSSSERSKNAWKMIVDDDESKGNQEHQSIERPCSLHDVNCIRRYFADNSRCSPAHGLTPDPYKMKTLPLPMAHANLTFTLNNFQIKGLSRWKIKEFYINRETDNLVLEVEFDNIVVYSDASELVYYRKGKEPITLSDYSIVEYRSVSFTMTVPNIKDLNLYKASVYTYLPDVNPKYGMGPNITESKDPEVSLAIVEFTLNASLSIREVYVQQGPVIMSIFLQNTICDFGYFPHV